MLGERRFGLLFLVALGVHVLVGGGASEAVARGWVGSAALLVARSSRRELIEVEVEPEALALPRVEVPVPPPLPDEAAPDDDRKVATNDASRSARGDRPAEPGNIEPPPGAPSPTNGPRSDEYDPLPPSGVLGVPGVGGPPVWSMQGVIPDSGRPAPAPTTAPRARDVDRDIAGKVIRQAMHENDKSKGIDVPAVGTAASAVQASLYGSDLPTEARGTIAIQIGPGGTVVGGKVVSMVGGTADQWEHAAQAAVAALKARHLDLPDEYKKGMIVYLDAVSVEQLPAGKGSGISGNTATFDVSNIGAKKRQVVRVRSRTVAIN